MKKLLLAGAALLALSACQDDRPQPPAVMFETPAQPPQPDVRDRGPNITTTGPRIGFDGRIHLLPGITPGMGF